MRPRQTREWVIAEPLAPNKLVEEIIEANFRYKRRIILNKTTTTNNYEEATESYIFDARFYKVILIHVINEHSTNAIKFKVLATIDGHYWKTLEEAGISEFELTANQEKELSFTVGWAFVKIQIKSSVADSHGEVTAFISGKSP